MTEMDDRMSQLLAETRARVAAIQGIQAQVALADVDEEDAEEAFARRARAGELGRDWAVLQARIDLGETTREAVMDGSDDSVAAHSVREAARAGVDHLAEEVREQAEQNGEPDPVAELRGERERLIARGEALRARLAAMVDGQDATR